MVVTGSTGRIWRTGSSWYNRGWIRRSWYCC